MSNVVSDASCVHKNGNRVLRCQSEVTRSFCVDRWNVVARQEKSSKFGIKVRFHDDSFECRAVLDKGIEYIIKS